MKEVMLEELNDFTTKNNTQSIKNEVSKENNASSSNGPIIAKPNIMKGSSISTSDLSKRLKEKHDKENESNTKSSNDVEETPMIKNAFSDMLKTLDDRKRKIDEELMPIIEKNAEEMAMAEELGIDTSKERLDDENVQALINKKRNEIEESSKPINFNDTSDIDNILNDGDEEDMEEIMDTTNNYTSIDNPVAEAPVKEEVNTVVEEVKPATVTVPKKEDTVEQTSKNLIEDDEDDLDKLMNDHPHKEINVVPVKNRFFGESITVTGLLTGQDIVYALKDINLGNRVLLSENILKADEEIFLDDMTLNEFKEVLQVDVSIVQSNGYDFVDCILES